MVDVPVRVEDRDGMRIITMARPERRNALTLAMVEAMAEWITAARDLPARAVIITGEGSVFCAGGDLPSLLAVASISATTAATSGAAALVPVKFGNESGSRLAPASNPGFSLAPLLSTVVKPVKKDVLTSSMPDTSGLLRTIGVESLLPLASK